MKTVILPVEKKQIRDENVREKKEREREVFSFRAKYGSAQLRLILAGGDEEKFLKLMNKVIV